MTGVKDDISGIKLTLNKQGQILRALEHKLDVVKVEQENGKHDINKLIGKVEEIEKVISIVETAITRNWNEIIRLKSII